MEQLISGKLCLSDIRFIVDECSRDILKREKLWRIVGNDNRQMSYNALWVMTHLQKFENDWVESLKDELIDRLLGETDTGKKRLYLQLLRNRNYTEDSIRTDFLDYCLSKINAESEPYAIRAFSLYAAFNMSKHYPELLNELEERLNLLSLQSISRGLESARRQVNHSIRKLRHVDR